MKKKLCLAICLCLLVSFCFTGCDLTELLNKDSAKHNINSVISDESADEVQMATDGREFFEAQIGEEIPVNARLFATINDVQVYDTLEESGYSESDEVYPGIVVKRENDFFQECGSECDFVVVNATLIYRSTKRAGELLKGAKENFLITSNICPYICIDLGEGVTTGYYSFSKVIFDYEVVEGGERAPVDNHDYFDMIEGQPLDITLVFELPKLYLDNAEEWGIAVANVMDSNHDNQHRIICK